jgi:dihydroorotate dehydrogenase electron transfer subunit
VDAEVLSNGRVAGAETGVGLQLVLRVPGWPGFLPGQFVMLSPGARGAVERTDPLLPRPMAVYRTRDEAAGTRVEVLYQAVGRGTGLLAEAKPGDRVRIVGPLGRPFPPPEGPTVLVGGGTGIASIYELAARSRGVTGLQIILGARSRDGLLGLPDFEALGCELTLTTEDGSAGEPGRVSDPLERLLAARAVESVYACGPTPMMARCAELAAEHGVRCLVSLENNMACGFGVCLGCAAPRSSEGYALVCREGPVFEAGQIDWAGLP